MKQFSTVRDTQRGSQSYMEKRRGRWEIEVTRSRGGGVKRRESSPASNQFPICSPQSGTPREIQSYIEKIKGMRKIEVTRRRRGRSQKKRDQSSK